jgi:putative PEP-CTERM system TPR-repeat lipoprotein
MTLGWSKGMKNEATKSRAGKVLSSLAVLSLLCGPVLAPQAAWAIFGFGSSSGSVAKAREHMNKNEWRAATIELKNVLQSDPNNVEARIMLGDAYLKTYNGPAAEKEFKAARQRGAKNADILLRLAKSYEYQRKYDLILNELLVDAVPKAEISDAYVVRGNAYLGLKKIDDAVSAYQKAQQIDPNNSETSTGLARVYLLQGQPDKAKAEADRALKLNPRSVDALLLKAELERLAGGYPNALKYLTSAVEVAPNYLPALMGRAGALVELGRYQEATADLDKLDRLAPNHPTTHYFRARIKWAQKDVKGAYEELQKTGSTLDNFLPAVFLSGLVDFAQNNLEQAAFHLSRVVANAPQHDGARRVLAMTLLRQDEAAKAIQTLQPLIDKGTADSKIYSMMGYANMKLGKLDESAKYFDLAVKSDPKEASNRTRQAVSRMALGEFDTAIKTLEGVVKEDPNSMQAAVILVMAELKKGDYKSALLDAQKLEKSFPKSPAGAYLQGEAQINLKNLVEARKDYERAQAISPDNAAPTMKLAAIDIVEGKQDAAIKKYTALVAKRPDYVPAMMSMAQLSQQRKDIPGAISWLEKAVANSKNDYTPGLQLLELYTLRGEREKALATANTLTQQHPDKPIVFEALGKVQGAFGDKLGAAATFERLTKMDPKNPATYHLLARSEVIAGQLNDARTNLHLAADLAPKGGKVDIDSKRMGTPFTILSDLVELEMMGKKYDAALAVTNDLDKAYPGSGVGDMVRGDIYLAQNKPNDALASFQKTEAKIKLTNGLVISYYRVYQVQGNHQKAFATLEDWLKTHKTDVAVRAVLGSAYLDAGRLPEAQTVYEGLLKEFPANPQYMNNLAWVYSQQGNPQALDLASKAYAAAPNSMAITDTYGWILVKQNKVDQALPLLKKAAFSMPPLYDARYHYAVALKATGQAALARKILQDVMASGARFSEYDAAKKLLAEMPR